MGLDWFWAGNISCLPNSQEDVMGVKSDWLESEKITGYSSVSGMCGTKPHQLPTRIFGQWGKFIKSSRFDGPPVRLLEYRCLISGNYWGC